MSTMLKTSNPEAIEEIDPGKDRRIPYVGQRVIFNGRPGEARFGRMHAIADVMNVEDDDHVELLIHYAADDALIRWKIPRRTEQNPYNSWSFTEHDQEHYLPGPAGAAPPEPTALAELKELRSHVQELRNRVAGLEATSRADASRHINKGTK